MRVFVLAVLAAWLGLGFNTANAEVTHPPLEAYGDLPSIRYMDSSPDGSKVAYVQRHEGADYVALFDTVTKERTYLLNIDEVETRGVFFADSENIIIRASDTKFVPGYRGEFLYSGAYGYNLKTKKLKFLLRGTDNIYPAQGGLGKIVGHDDESGYIFMPAWMGDRYSDPNYSLLRVNMKTGKGRRFKSGNGDTIDWFVDTDGTVLAREDYNNQYDAYKIYTYINGNRELVYEAESPRIPFSLIGVKPDRSGLIIMDDTDSETGFNELYEMDFSGNITSANLERDDADIQGVYTDGNRFMVGVRYSGAVPAYKFFDPEVDAAVAEVVARFPNAAIHVDSWSDDWTKILYRFYASDTPGSFVLQDRTTGALTLIADTRDNIPPDALGQAVAVSYVARDGLKIPAIVTWPAGVDLASANNLPLIVMPHGGPASYSGVGFHWRAQYFANRGYLVLQPNFRGSTGYGNEFEELGHGEWGLKMQDDVTDGVNMLVKEGLADPDRVCIVGASYGGYSALAGGAYTPDLYKCVVAIAPVTDLRRMLSDERWDLGKNHWVLDYWHEVIGDPQAEREKLDAISPANAAENFTAPVLLIHGKDDLVVPIKQSRIMEDALKRAGKSVTFLELEGEDHWMSDGDTRIDALRAMAIFIDQHIGAEAE